MSAMHICSQCEIEWAGRWPVHALEMHSGMEYDAWICTPCFKQAFNLEPSSMTAKQIKALPAAFTFDGEA